MSELQNLIVNKLEKVETDLGEMKVTLAENTKDMKHHISRTDGLQDIVEDLNKIVQPMYEDYIAKRAVEQYKKERFNELMEKVKLPSYILGAIVTIGTIVAWFWSK